MGVLAGQTILLRADGGGSAGLGHVMRCLALADALASEGANPVLWTKALPEPVAALYQSRGYAIVDHPPTAKADWLVIDSYAIGPEERGDLSASAGRLAVIDDLADSGPYACDLLLNPNPRAEAKLYTESQIPSVLAGAEYVLLRQEILAKGQQHRDGRAERILISCGGTDPFGLLPDVLAALETLPQPPKAVRVLSGVSTVAETVCDIPVEYVTADFDMARHLEWADLAILAAGTVQWEAAFLGCPFVALVAADNQHPGAMAFAAQGGSTCLDWRETRDAAALATAISDTGRLAVQAKKAESLIDGQGGKRIAAAMAQMV